jgi:deoxyribodipyrimidine photo-lyase
VDSNHALAHAVAKANELNLPLLCYEGLTYQYPHANDRLHTFILEGVPETARRLKAIGIGYVFYLRQRRSDPDDILYRLAADAALAVTDDYPVFITPLQNASVAGKIGVAFHAVDSSCIVPMNCFTKREYAAYSIRPKIHSLLPEYLRPVEMPALRRRYRGRTPEFHTRVTERNIPELVASSEIDHSIAPSISFRGGRIEAERRRNTALRCGYPRFPPRCKPLHIHPGQTALCLATCSPPTHRGRMWHFASSRSRLHLSSLVAEFSRIPIAAQDCRNSGEFHCEYAA